MILNIIDVKEANARKTTFNICVSIISVVTCIGAYLETTIDDLANASHLVFEAIGLIVLCLIYFSTSVELLRKLRIFVLEETLKEARLVQLQFFIFFIAYTSKILTLMYWIKNPPHDRSNLEGFLINTNVMGVIWVMIPVLFLMCMQIRSFKKMKDEKMQLLVGVEADESIIHPDGTRNGQLNKTDAASMGSPEPGTPFKDYNSSMRGSHDNFSSSFKGRLKNRFESQQSYNPVSMLDSVSHPGTTSSLQDYFEKCNPDNEN